jgi:hypothetical protein
VGDLSAAPISAAPPAWLADRDATNAVCAIRISLSPYNFFRVSTPHVHLKSQSVASLAWQASCLFRLSAAISRAIPEAGGFHMKNLTKLAISLIGISAIPFFTGCSSSSPQPVKEISSTTTYVPAPQQVVVQPPPVVTVPPSTVTTTEEKRSSNSTDTGNNETEESSNAYHSESSTVTPMTSVPAAPQTQTTTTYQKKTYEETN